MNIVRELRKKAGIQQKELALESGVSNAAVSDWENGKKDPTGERLEKLAEFFGVDKFEILGSGKNEARDVFTPADPRIVGVSETEQIVQHIIDKLNIHQPQTTESRIISEGVDKMPPEDREKALGLLKMVYSQYFEPAKEKNA